MELYLLLYGIQGLIVSFISMKVRKQKEATYLWMLDNGKQCTIASCLEMLGSVSEFFWFKTIFLKKILFKNIFK
jgi:hypothetical protein